MAYFLLFWGLVISSQAIAKGPGESIHFYAEMDSEGAVSKSCNKPARELFGKINAHIKARKTTSKAEPLLDYHVESVLEYSAKAHRKGSRPRRCKLILSWNSKDWVFRVEQVAYQISRISSPDKVLVDETVRQAIEKVERKKGFVHATVVKENFLLAWQNIDLFILFLSPR